MKRPDMLNDNVAGALFRLVLPMIPGTLSIVLFNLADTYFVGQLGAGPLAAMSFSFPVVLISGGLAMGLGIGTSTYVSHALGANDRPEAGRLATQAHLLAFSIVLVLAVVGLFTIEPLFTAMGATPEVLPLVRDYMTIWFIGLPFVILPMVGMNVLQATGDTKIPGMVLTLSVMLNIALDPILIFGLGPIPSMGISGAAVATVIGRASSFAIVGTVIFRRERLFRADIGPIAAMARNWGKILFVGVPAAAANILLPISMGVITRFVSAFGTNAVAGFGAATRIESFALVFTLALSMILTPFVGQNHGAGNERRVVLSHRVASLFSLAWSAMVLVVFVVAANPIARAFNDTPEVVAVTAQYLTIVAASYGFLGIVNLTAAAFNGLKRPMSAAGVAALRLFVLLIPLAYVGRELFDLAGVFWGVMAGNVLAGVSGFVWFWLNRRRVAGRAATSHADSPRQLDGTGQHARVRQADGTVRSGGARHADAGPADRGRRADAVQVSRPADKDTRMQGGRYE
jgi:putative MATE family efflux protein